MSLAQLASSPLSSSSLACHAHSQLLSNSQESSCSRFYSPSKRDISSLDRFTALPLVRHHQNQSKRRGIRVTMGTRPSSSQELEGIRFPFLAGSAQMLLTGIAKTLDKELGPHLLSSQTPADVSFFRSPEGNAEGSVVLRAGKDSKETRPLGTPGRWPAWWMVSNSCDMILEFCEAFVVDKALKKAILKKASHRQQCS